MPSRGRRKLEEQLRPLWASNRRLTLPLSRAATSVHWQVGQLAGTPAAAAAGWLVVCLLKAGVAGPSPLVWTRRLGIIGLRVRSPIRAPSSR